MRPRLITCSTALVATVDQQTVSGNATGTAKTRYVHPDHLGSTNVVTDENDAVVQTLDYYPYGATPEFAKVEAAAAVHRADFERERERCERLMAEVLKTTAELMAAREATARIAGELAAYQARPWWRRLAG
jgi:hypothetical protein